MTLAARSRASIAFVIIASATLALFADGRLDLAVAGWFFSADAADHWPLAAQQPWRALYSVASGITLFLAGAGLAGFALSLRKRFRQWRNPATLLLLSLALGPGLLGNAVLKDHWCHPRPRELVEFGGTMHYVAAPLPGREGGASFPCGHCTVGFLCGIGWWVCPRRRSARASLLAGLILGSLLGVGRMAAGAHFLSDIVWSAILAFGVTHVLHRYVLRDPGGAPRTEQIAGGGAGVRGRLLAWAAALGGAVVLLVLTRAPHGTALTESVSLGPSAPRTLEILADRADLELVLSDAPPDRLFIDGELHGFGLPFSRLGAHLEMPARPSDPLRYVIEDRGLVTDLDAHARIRLPAAAFKEIHVSVRAGNLRLVDATRDHISRRGILRVELRTAQGKIERIEAP